MSTTQLKQARRTRRKRRVRAKVSGTGERPRISVYRSNRGVSAQLIDDTAGRTLASVNWTEADLRKLNGIPQAKKAGEILAERAKQAGVESAVFDRNGFLYHGRVQAFAEGVREGGLAV
ncbi:MAG: 50S ribosomal protein L18 [Actinobacteria bacterium]|nr:50S ribosomal protein L18 [Actinomycetota bacterium]